MRVALDAKRAFLNQTGLGNYSRTVINGLTKTDLGNELFLCTPKITDQFWVGERLSLILPKSASARKLSGLWRSKWIVSQLVENQIDIYHGLSNELPFGIENTGIRSVVTIHDLIFLRFPEFYPAIDKSIYEKKVRHACNVADRIIAISEQTKDDLISLLKVRSEKIDVIYQTCHPRFSNWVDADGRKRIAWKYNLPENFILSVGTVEKRKNHQQVIKAIGKLANTQLELVIVGGETRYARQLEKLCKTLDVESRVHFLFGVPHEDLPSIYQLAKVFVYTSLYEGFGIPVLEALNSGVPVVTSKGGCLEEVGGSQSLYVDPNNEDELAKTLQRILQDDELSVQMVTEGKKHASQFSEENMINGVQRSYNRIIGIN